MLTAEQVPSEVIRKAMHTFQVQMDEEECSVGQSWAIILAAAINAWPGMSTKPVVSLWKGQSYLELTLPLPKEPGA